MSEIIEDAVGPAGSFCLIGDGTCVGRDSACVCGEPQVNHEARVRARFGID